MLVAALQGCDWDADKAYKVRVAARHLASPSSAPSWTTLTCSRTLTHNHGGSPHNAVCAAQQVMAKFSMQSGGAGRKEPSEKKSKKEKAKHKKERKRKHSSKRKDSDSDSGSDSSECAIRAKPPLHETLPYGYGLRLHCRGAKGDSLHTLRASCTTAASPSCRALEETALTDPARR